jgi:hypothetical protein
VGSARNSISPFLIGGQCPQLNLSVLDRWARPATRSLFPPPHRPCPWSAWGPSTSVVLRAARSGGDTRYWLANALHRANYQKSPHRGDRRRQCLQLGLGELSESILATCATPRPACPCRARTRLRPGGTTRQSGAESPRPHSLEPKGRQVAVLVQRRLGNK